MATLLDHPNECGGTTNHGDEIAMLRLAASVVGTESFSDLYLVAADLLELHDRTGISLDHWTSARRLIEGLLEAPILENHA